MKLLRSHKFDPAQARKEWHEFVLLLNSKATLDERNDILPFFSARWDLSLLISHYFPAIRQADVLAHEFDIGGDFRADLILGDSTQGTYLLVEFENASASGIFQGKKAKRAWSRRFEGAFSQLVDWLWKLEDQRSTSVLISAES